MDNLQDLLNKKDYSEPPEIKLIKDYVKNEFNSDVSITVEQNRIIIHASSSALASSLHSNIVQLQEISESSKKIQIYTG